MVRPPRPGEPSYELYAQERDGILGELKARAVLLAEGLNRIPGIQCNVVAGAMYAFPRITLPAGRTDEEYCMALLEETGICVVPGSGFGQIPGHRALPHHHPAADDRRSEPWWSASPRSTPPTGSLDTETARERRV